MTEDNSPETNTEEEQPQLRAGRQGCLRPFLGVILLATSAGVLLAISTEADGRLPLITENVDYTEPAQLVRGSLAAFGFALALASVRIALAMLLSIDPPPGSRLPPEIQALISLEYQDSTSRAMGLRFVSIVLGIVIAIALLVAFGLLGFAIWRISPI